MTRSELFLFCVDLLVSLPVNKREPKRSKPHTLRAHRRWLRANGARIGQILRGAEWRAV